MTSKIGIIGSGVVGQTLANGFVAHGYEVTIGTNSPGSATSWVPRLMGRRPLARSRTRHGSVTRSSWRQRAVPLKRR